MSAFALTREKQITVPIADREVVLVLTDDARKQAAVTRVRAALKALPQAQRVQALETVLAQLNVAHDRLWSAWDGLRPLEPAELKRLPEAGIEVGSHTCSHPIVSRLNAADMERELRESRRTLEGAVGRACTQFAYPNGGPDDFDATTGAAVRAAGYTSAVTTIKRRVARTDGCFEIPRCTLTHNALTMTEFAAEASGFAGMLRAARDRRAGSRRGDAALRVSAHPNPRTEPR